MTPTREDRLSAFVRELLDADLLTATPELAAEAEGLLLRPRHQPVYDPDHPLVRCPDCEGEYTACDLGNHYCPSCGESSDGAEEVPCEGCPCTIDLLACCWCGKVHA